MDYILETTERFDGALAAAAEAHRDELHALRMAVTVLALEVDGKLTEEARGEPLRIAKLYANVLTMGGEISDITTILSDGLAGRYVVTA